MKKLLFLTTLFMVTACTLYAQQTDYKVVFDMSSRDSISQQAVIRELDLIKKANPAAMLEVVIYGQALNLVTKDQSKHAEAIGHLLEDSNITFKVCAVTMKRNNVNESGLLPGVKVVPDGIYEIISKQHAGWGYIKVAH